jgi:hypothetical protein
MTHGIARYAPLFLSLVLPGMLIAGPAAGQDVDTKGEKELTTVGQKIDKTGAGADSGRVTTRIVDQWKGTQFQFDAGSPPRALTAQDVQDLRAKRLGFGEISILLALAAKQSSTNPKTVDQILAMRERGEGWGKLARDLGYKNLGSVLSSVKATDKGVTRVASERGPQVDKVSGTDKPDKPEKMSKPDKPERIERVERPEKPERPGR